MQASIYRYYSIFINICSSIAFPLCTGFFVAMLVVRFNVYASADGISFGTKGVIGGDFLAFWTSSKAFLAGQALEMYDRDLFEAALAQKSGLEKHHMMWQYPPTAFLLLPSLGMLEYEASYWLWMFLTGGLLLGTLRAVGIDWRYALMVFCAPLSMLVLNAGQISFLTTALLILATYFAKSRPLIAGIAAGVLTIKPQLGVLLPFVFLISGCWRAFAIAGMTAIALALLATLSFGWESWSLFYDSITRIYDDFTLDGGSTPANGMTTLMSQMNLLGAGHGLASVAHYSMAFVVSVVSVGSWYYVKAADLRMGIVCAAAILITPYAYAYEMIVLVAPTCVIIQRAMNRGWLSGERPTLLISWVLLIGSDVLPVADVIQVPFWLTMYCFVAILRRASLEVERLEDRSPLIPAKLTLSV